ncbi:MAG: hypothetical protein Q8K82_20155 [Gemmatimonadaceae bacterium]|nr:hypothetical protein [Gemmatimonadaceae bacterium]
MPTVLAMHTEKTGWQLASGICTLGAFPFVSAFQQRTCTSESMHLKQIAIHPFSFVTGVTMAVLMFLAMGQRTVEDQVLIARKLVIQDKDGKTRFVIEGTSAVEGRGSFDAFDQKGRVRVSLYTQGAESAYGAGFSVSDEAGIPRVITYASTRGGDSAGTMYVDAAKTTRAFIGTNKDEKGGITCLDSLQRARLTVDTEKDLASIRYYEKDGTPGRTFP